MRSEVRIGPQSLSYGFQNEIMDHSCSDRGLISNKTDVPNFVKDVPNFVKDVPRVPKCVPRWRPAPNHFFMCF